MLSSINSNICALNDIAHFSFYYAHKGRCAKIIIKYVKCSFILSDKLSSVHNLTYCHRQF